MITITLSADEMLRLRRELVGGRDEACAVLLSASTTRPDGLVRLLVRETVFPLPSDYVRRGWLVAELDPQFVARMARRARDEKLSLVFVHSHPGDHPPQFSPVDWDGEQRLATFLAYRLPGAVHGAIVVSAGGASARRLGTSEGARVVSIGASREVVADPSVEDLAVVDQFDRQVRAFGVAGQRMLQSITVGIVGLGGMGSIVAQQLVHLGVRRFVLVDPDTVEPSNLNRVANATPTDVGAPKVAIAERYIRQVSPDAEVCSVKGDVTRVAISSRLTNVDFLFGCTDSHGSRAVLQQVAYQYLIPCIDTGTTIVAKDGQVSHIFGRIQLLAPGFACLNCSGLLNSEEVRRDMMSAFERQSDPYIQGAREPAPAVMSINGTAASMAVTMLLSVVAGIPMEGRYLLYDAKSSLLRKAHVKPDPECFVCSLSGGCARGDAWPLLGRKD